MKKLIMHTKSANGTKRVRSDVAKTCWKWPAIEIHIKVKNKTAPYRQALMGLNNEAILDFKRGARERQGRAVGKKIVVVKVVDKTKGKNGDQKAWKGD